CSSVAPVCRRLCVTLHSPPDPMRTVTVFTDGACAGNPGPGGWAAILIDDGQRREISGYVPSTTNNRMELAAAIEALRRLPESAIVDLHTDSQYVRTGMSDWLARWKSHGRGARGPPAGQKQETL